MRDKNTVTEYSEVIHNKKGRLSYLEEPASDYDSYADDFYYADDDEDVVEFSESDLDELEDLEDEIDEAIESIQSELPDDGVVEFSEVDLELPGPGGHAGVDVVLIPGSDMPLEEDEEEEEEVQKDWANDRDPGAFMSYLMDRYPHGIPRHSGTSIVGAERASNFLNTLNKEISEAVRCDKEGVLDLGVLEDVRVRIMNDLLTLKSLIKKLQKNIKDRHKSAEHLGDDELVKEATTPRVQLIMTPFERAMSGIIVNAVVSAGHPFEDVWDFLKTKYSWTPREEISVLQLTADLGYPIFKDRGTLGESADSAASKEGVDFIKNYFG